MTTLALYAAVADSVPMIRCSPPSWAAQLALLEEGVAHAIHWLRFDRGDHRTPEMLRLHPGGTVPVLVDGDVVLSDTVEILEHIVKRSSEQRLALREDNVARRHDAMAVKDAGMSAFRSLMKSLGASEIWRPLEAALATWEERLARDASLDIATLLVFVYVETACSLGLPTGAWPRLEAFMSAMRQRTSVRTAWPDTWPALI